MAATSTRATRAHRVPAPRRPFGRWFGRAGTRALLVAGLLVVLLVGCGDDGSDDVGDVGTAPEAPVAASPVVVAQDTAFDPQRVTIPADEPVTLTFDNRDDGVSHNLHVSAPGEPATDVSEGPGQQQLELSLEPGDYDFRCDVHASMRGTIVAEP